MKKYDGIFNFIYFSIESIFVKDINIVMSKKQYFFLRRLAAGDARIKHSDDQSMYTSPIGSFATKHAAEENEFFGGFEEFSQFLMI